MRAAVIRFPNPFDPRHHETAVLRRPARIRRLVPADRPAIAVLNGRPILRAGWRRRLRDGDHLAVITLPRGGGGGGKSNPLRLVLQLALMAFAPFAAGALGTAFGMGALGVNLTQLGIYMAGSALINAVLPPPKADTSTASPTYTLQAQGNAARIDQPIPVQYGRVLSYPDFASQPYVEFSGNEQYAFYLLCLGAGEYDVEELRIEDTPISSFSEIETQIVPPGGQVTLFPTAVVTSVEVSGQDMPGRTAGTWSQSGGTITVTETGHLRAVGQAVHLEFTTGGGPTGVYTITGVATDTFTVTAAAATASGDVLIRSVLGGATGFVASGPETVAHRLGVDIVLPQGLVWRGTDGKLYDLSVTLRVEAQRIDDLGAPVGGWVLLGEETVTDRTNTPQRRSFTYALGTPGRYRVRAWRIDEKAEGAAAAGGNHAHDVLWAGLRAYLSEPEDYGPVTLIAMRLRASNNLSAQASRRVAVLATRKLPVWNGTSWSAPQPTRSIAWALADAARNAGYGPGLPDSRLDLPALLALDAVWSARGDTFNGRFDAESTWWDAASKIAMAGRAKVFLQGGRLRVARDGGSTLPVALFSERNIVKGSFGTDFAMPGEATADAVDVGIFDGTVWQPRRIKARLPGSTATKPGKIDLFGVTDGDQAMREGLYHAASNRFRRETVRFETEMEGFIPSIGDLIAVQHSMPDWGQQAEAVAWDPATLTLTVNEALDWAGTGHVVGLRGRGGEAIGPIPCTRGASDAQLVLAALPSEAPFTGPDAERTQVAFGVAETWRAPCIVASVTPRGLHRVLIEAVVDDPSVHTADTGAVAPPVRYSALPGRIVLPVVTQLLARLVPGEGTRCVIAWTPAPGADSYHVEMAEGSDLTDTTVSWTRVHETTATQHLSQVLDPARTMVRVRGVGVAPGPWLGAVLGELVGLYWLDDPLPFWGADPAVHWRS